MGFTVNKVRHFYVATNSDTSNLVIKHEGTAKTAPTDRIQETDPKGTVKVHINKDKNHLYFEYKSPAGGMRSDLIPLDKISYVKHTKAKSLRYVLKQHKLSFTEANLKGEFIAKVTFKQVMSLDEGKRMYALSNYYSSSTKEASVYLKNMALDLAKTIYRSYNGSVSVALETNGSQADMIGTLKVLDKNTKLADLTETYTGIVITELPQVWSRDLRPQWNGIDFEVHAIAGNDEDLGKFVSAEIAGTTETDGRYIPNGQKIADMEYFYTGARGDAYKSYNYPDIIHTEYLANSTKEYDVLDIHFAYSDQGVFTYNSEKDITIAGSDGVITAIVAAIKEETKAKGTVIEEC